LENLSLVVDFRSVNLPVLTKRLPDLNVRIAAETEWFEEPKPAESFLAVVIGQNVSGPVGKSLKDGRVDTEVHPYIVTI